MSVSIYFQAIIPVDGDLYRKHKAVVDACEDAGVPVPAESAAFFDDNNEEREVTKHGIRVGIGAFADNCAVEGDVMYDDGAIVDLSKLPPGTTKIRVYAS
jgi:hypothetical protein